MEDVFDLELELLLEGVARRWGYDFRNYARGSLRRRLARVMRNEQVPTLSDLQARVLRDERCLARLVSGLTVNVTSMFRDPGLYLRFRQTIVPLLRTYPFVRIWHAGCSTGEEVYSLAILLAEEGLYDRCRLYATDLSEEVITRARRGVFPLASILAHTSQYHEAGGTGRFSDHYVADEHNAIMRERLRENIVFSPHNLVTDTSFNEFNVIFCRNVLIYFDGALRQRVHDVLYDSLGQFGLLVLGIREVVNYTPHVTSYECVDATHRIYRRIR